MSGENFDGYIAVEAGIARTVDFPHAARTQRRNNFVGPKSLARGYGHKCAQL
jgi:hypothetical protein